MEMDLGSTRPAEGTPTDDGGMEVDLDPNATAAGARQVASKVNLVDSMTSESDRRWLDKQAARAVSDVDSDLDSRTGYYRRRADILKMFTGDLPKMGYPADGGRPPHLPLLQKTTNRVWARVADTVCPAGREIVHVIPMTAWDQDRQQRLSKHMNWQVRTESSDWQQGLVSSAMQWVVFGDMVRFVGWDVVRDRPLIEFLMTDDVIFPYSYKDVSPLMENMPRVARVLRKDRRQLEELVDKGYYARSVVEEFYPEGQEEVASGQSPSTFKKSESPIQQQVDRTEGQDAGSAPLDPDGPREFYEVYKWLRLPGESRAKPVALTVDRQARKALRLVVRTYDDPKDRARYDRQKAAVDQAYQNNLQLHSQMLAAHSEHARGAEMGIVDHPGEPPAPPPVPQAPDPVKQKILYNLVHYWMFPNPEGNLGLGMGHLTVGLNEAANEMLQEYILSAKFANLQSGFISRDAKMARGDIQLKMGWFKEVDVSPEDLQKMFAALPTHPPAEGLLKGVELMDQGAVEVTSASESLSGAEQKSHTTATEVKSQVSQALQSIAVAVRLFRWSLTEEFKLYAVQNMLNLPESVDFSIPTADPTQKPQSFTVSWQDYAEDFHITFSSEEGLASDEERQSVAQQVLALIANEPELASNPVVRLRAAKKMLMALRQDDLAALVPDQPPQPPPPTPQSQEQENQGFFNETDHPVLPDDNHAEHFQKILELEANPRSRDLSSTGRQMLDRHKRAHAGALYRMEQEAMNGARRQAGPGPGIPGGPAGMAPGPGNGGPPPGPPLPGGPGPGPGSPPGGLPLGQ